MELAILVTNTDDSAFARARPPDDAKFAALINSVRPHWRCTPYWVCQGAFPETLERFDGVMITGSPASVRDEAPWMVHLEALVRGMVDRGQPLFGACFGHQIIAKALGAGIIRNPLGWGHGRLELTRLAATPWAGAPASLSLYGSHIEQVAQAPEGARVVFEGSGLPVAGFALGDTVFTIQHHPEMSPEFIRDLIHEYAGHVGDEVTAQALRSLAQPADSAAFAEEIARFFEHAAHARKAREPRA